MPPKKTPLRAVAEDEVAPAKPKVHARITDALEGSSRDVLASMRRALARRLDNDEISSNAIASAYKELRELDRLIRQLDAAKAESDAEDAHVDDRFNADAV